MDSEWLLSLLAIIVLLICSAFFSSSETGLTAVNRAHIFRLASENNRRARLVQRLLEEKEALISAILLGNNAVNILASAVATGLAIELWGRSGVAYATVAMTLLVFIFAEVLPKSYALHRSERVALLVAPLLNLVVKLLSPVNVAIKWMLSGMFRLFGVDSNTDIAGGSVSELLRGTIEMHHQEGQMMRQDRDMLGGLLELEDMTVEDAMIHRTQVVALDADLSVGEIMHQAISCPHSRLPIYRGDLQNVQGVLHTKDLLRLIDQKGRAGITVKDLLRIAGKPWFVPCSTSLKSQLHAFRQRRQHFALVVDEYGTLMGIVTLEDVIEEIVGEIDDEYDTIDLSNLVQVEDGVWLADGDVGIRDLNRYLGWDLEDDEANTLAGLVLHEARDIPEPGAEFIIQGIRFTVEARTVSQVTRLRMEPLAQEDDEDEEQENE